MAVRAGVLASALLLAVGCTEQLPTVPAVQDPVRPSLNISPGEGPSIATDKQDYSPGETVAINGWEWTPGESVRLQIVHTDELGDNSRPEHQPWVVTADATGHISSSWEILVGGDEDGATLKLTADGLTSDAHAEVTFTDLTGTVNLFSDALRTTAQTAFQWNSTVYPRIRSPAANTCYRLRWTDPSGDLVATFHETSSSPGSNADPAGFAVSQESGVWSLVVDQRASGTCSNEVGYGSGTNAFLFDVAREVVLGAGTSSLTDPSTNGGDQCVYQTNNINASSIPVCQNPGGGQNTTMFVRKQTNDAIHSFVRFDLTTISPAIPAGALVTDAKVRLTVAGTAGTVASPRTYDIQRSDAEWAEGTVTWGTQPGVTGPINSSAMAHTLVAGGSGADPQTFVRWTVSADVQGFVNGSTNNGWRISDASATTSSSAGRFHTTENASGCFAGVTTCKRVWPVLLIDWVDPPKLAFVTTAKTGQVGQCLGPIRVQSQTSGGSPLAVGADLTVNLSTANLGTGGAGSFFSDATCATALDPATVSISSGNTNSSDFYYRATGVGDGGHDVVASATGYTPDASQTQTITRATTSLVYTGDLIVLAGGTLNLRAVLSSAFEGCIAGKTISWRISPDPTDGVGFLQLSNSTTDASGVATQTTSTTGWPEGIYEIDAFMVDNQPNCLPSKDDVALAVLMPGNAATGGGFLAGSAVGGGRVNFGFNVRPVPDSDPIAYRGQALIMKTLEWRCKGPLTVYGTTNGTNVAGGTCDFQIWDPTADGGLGDWVVAPDGEDRAFTIRFVDNGTGKGKNAGDPDTFGFQISGVAPDPSFGLADIKGGNIDVKDSGGSTTTTGGGGNGRRR